VAAALAAKEQNREITSAAMGALSQVRLAWAILFFICSIDCPPMEVPMIDDYLAGYDFNLPLDDAAADPEIPPVRRVLAFTARSEGLDGGYYEAAELADAFRAAAREADAANTDPDSPARLVLEDILGRGVSYQRALFDTVAALPLADAASHLGWLAELMGHRADMYHPVTAARGAVA
jgi:hypothetical protein